MKKTFIAFMTFIFALFFTPVVFSHTGEQGNVKVDDIVSEILRKQGVGDISQIDCSKVSDEDFERLGEAVMNYMHPDEELHKAMDEMMGGEGSESLRRAHIFMGKRFLGCSDVPGFMGMMGRGMMPFDDVNNSFKERGWENMKGAMYGFMGVWSLLGILSWVLLVIFLTLGSIYFWKEIRRKK